MGEICYQKGVNSLLKSLAICSDFPQIWCMPSLDAVLTAIAIPVFTNQLERSRESTDLANVRSAYAEAVTAYLSDGTAQSITVESKQTQDGWQYVDGVIGTTITTSGGTSGS